MNAYFQIVISEQGNFLKYFPPTDGGEQINLQEVMQFMEAKKIPYDVKTLGQGLMRPNPGKLILLNKEKMYPITECCLIKVDDGKMRAVARFYPPSTGGREATKEDILSECRLSKILFGVDESAIDSFLKDRKYCTDYDIAKGVLPVEGKDAYITYNFNTDNQVRPTLREDGTVDFFNLNIVNHCKVGDVLAVLTPEVKGTPGTNVCGEMVKPRDVKHASLSYGLNIQLSEDHNSISSKVNGHVTLTGGKVFVSDVMEVTNVDNATGNITYEGNVVVAGNVASNFSIKTNGNIEVRGTVEGAYLEAGGNIVLHRGMNGMGKGTLKAGGNIIAKFLENCKAEAGGYVETNSILHSKVQAQTEINVMSRKGFITGGSVTATKRIRVRTLGTMMGADTLVTVGVNPAVINRMSELNKIINESEKNLKTMMPVMEAMKKKLAAGVKFSPDQVKQVQTLAQTIKTSQEQLESGRQEMETLQEQREEGSRATVEVAGEVYPGTVIGIGGVSMVIRDTMQYCRFVYEKGNVKMAPL